jgi:hypothetical protein
LALDDEFVLVKHSLVSRTNRRSPSTKQAIDASLAEQGLFITIARLLWAFDVKKALDPNGKEIPVDINSYTNGAHVSYKFMRPSRPLT